MAMVPMKLKPYWKHNVLNFYESQEHAAFRTGVWANCPLLAIQADPTLAQQFFEDFNWYYEYSAGSAALTKSGQWAMTEDGGETGTTAVQDAAGGWFKMFCDGDDNDECYLATAAEIFTPSDGNPMWFEARLKLTEASTNAANWIIGLSESVGANHLQNNGGGPPATYDGVVFFKVDGTMYIQFETSTGSSQTTTSDLNAFVSGTTYRVGFYFDGGTSVTPYVNDTAGDAHTISLSGLGEMSVFMGVKAGSDNEEAIEVDYIRCIQFR